MNVDEETLVEVVRCLEDYNEATNALTELKYINPVRASEVAIDVLEKGKGDSHFQASAFEVLYSANHIQALDYINNYFSSADLLTFRSMLECVTEDSSLVQGSPELQHAVKILMERVNKLSSEDCGQLGDSLDWFNATFKFLAG